MEIKKKSNARSKTVEINGTRIAEFGRFRLKIEDDKYFFIFHDPDLFPMRTFLNSQPKGKLREIVSGQLTETVKRLKAFDKGQAIAELEEAIKRINELI